MSDKNKTINALKAKMPQARKAANEDNICPQANVQKTSKALTDEEALALGVSSLRQVRNSVTQKEQWAIKSMMSYVAFKQNISEETVRSILLAHLDVEEMMDIPAKQYDQAICFLVDFNISKILN